MSLQYNEVTKLTKRQFIEIISKSIPIGKKSNKSTLKKNVLKTVEEVQNTITNCISNEINHVFDEYINSRNDLTWCYVQDNTTQIPYFYIEHKDYDYINFCYELALGDHENTDIDIRAFCMAIFYDNVKRFHHSTLTNKAVSLLKRNINKEEKAILTFITELELFS